ncbi:hypothetical protein [Thermaurantiacus sp.]
MRLTELAIAAALGFAAVPAIANPSPSEICAVAPGALRTLAATAEGATQRRALRDIQLGEQLCEARNRPEAARKFRAAAAALGTDLQTAMANVTKTAAVQ